LAGIAARPESWKKKAHAIRFSVSLEMVPPNELEKKSRWEIEPLDGDIHYHACSLPDRLEW